MRSVQHIMNRKNEIMTASVPVLSEKEVNAIHEKGKRELLKASKPILLENECNEKKGQITAFISIKVNSD